jgi:hypothetical protein
MPIYNYQDALKEKEELAKLGVKSDIIEYYPSYKKGLYYVRKKRKK